MAELRSLLAFMDPEDRDRALRRYEQLFDRAGEDGEEELLRQLGSPIRQVLEVEQEYRRARKEGKIIYSEELPAVIPEAAEMIPARSEELPSDLGQTVREAAAALEQYDWAKAGFSDETDEPEEDLFPIADLNFSDAPMPGEDGTEPDDSEPRLVQIPVNPVPETEASKAAEPIPTQKDDGEVEHIMRLVPEPPAEKSAAKETKSTDEKGPGVGRVMAAILVTAPILLLWALGLALFLALGAAALAAGFAFCAVGVYLAGYAVGGYIAFMPDLLLVCGGALGCFAMALFFLWTGLWIAVGGLVALIRLTGKIYRGILKKRRREEDEDDE